MYHVEALETDFRAPATKVTGAVIECIAEFDQHV